MSIMKKKARNGYGFEHMKPFINSLFAVLKLQQVTQQLIRELLAAIV